MCCVSGRVKVVDNEGVGGVFESSFSFRCTYNLVCLYT